MGLTGPPPLVVGSGRPVTLVAHGLGGSVTETRPLGGGLPGTRVFPTARGHGPGPVAGRGEPVTYELLGRDLAAVADAHGATRALGVSMGAGALLSLLAREPARFSRVVLMLPAALDGPRTDAAAQRVLDLAAALDARHRPAVEALVRREVPTGQDVALCVVEAYVRARAGFLLASPGVVAVLRSLPDGQPVEDRARLGDVRSEVLVLAQEGDPLHPAQVARELVAVLPRARLVVFDRPGVVFRERARLRALITGFLGAPDDRD